MGAVGTAEIRTSSISELQEHAGDAIDAHHEEVGFGKLNIDWQRLSALEQAGIAIVLAAWDGDTIVGYSMAFALDQIDTLDRYCQGHAIFVLPSYRKGTDLGRRLVRATEGAADAQGCVSTVWQAKPGGKLSTLLQSLGYVPREQLYAKILGKRKGE